FGPLTTPPRSLSPMVTCGGTLCCACDGAGDNVAAAMAAALKYRLVVRIIGALLVRSCALSSQRSCDRARGLGRRRSRAFVPHIHAQSIADRNGSGGRQPRTTSLRYLHGV